MMKLTLNGDEITVAPNATVADLLRERQLDRTACAVEVNRKVVPKRQHTDHHLHDGDRVEIVTLVGGG